MIKNEKNEVLIPTNEKYEPFAFASNGYKYYKPKIIQKQGTEVEYDDTYNDIYDSLKIECKAVQEDTPSPDYPTKIVDTDCDVVSEGQDTPYHPPTFAHVTGGGIGEYRDYYEIYWDSDEKQRKVRFVENTISFDISALLASQNVKFSHFSRFSNIESECCYVYGNDVFGTYGNPTFRTPAICNRFVINRNITTDSTANSFFLNLTSNPPYISFRIRNELTGISSEDTSKNKLNKLKQWLLEHNTVVFCASENPLETDITDTPTGKALLAMRTYPHYTHIYTNAEIQPWLSADVRVIER